MAPSERPSARAISRLSMPSAKRMISASRRSSGSMPHPVEHAAELVAPLDQLLGRVRRGERRRLVDRRGRLARAVAVEVRGEVVRDADQPRAQRPPVRFALRALEVPVGLQERLLGQVLGVVVVADAVVGVAVDVAQMRAVELGELRVELGLGLLAVLLGHSLHTIPHGPPRPTPRARSRAARSRASAPARCALAPPSHSHCRRTHAQMRSVTPAASAGEERSTVGNSSGRPTRMRTLRGRMRQPRRTSSVPITATGTTGAPVSSARRPTPRCGSPSGPAAHARALREDDHAVAAFEDRARGRPSRRRRPRRGRPGRRRARSASTPASASRTARAWPCSRRGGARACRSRTGRGSCGGWRPAAAARVRGRCSRPMRCRRK